MTFTPDAQTAPDLSLSEPPPETLETVAQREQLDALAAVTAPAPDPVVEPSEQAESPEEPSFAEIFGDFQRSSQRREPGDANRIRATILTVGTESILLDIGFKTEGILPLAALPANREPGKSGDREPVKIGDTLLVSVKGRDVDGYYELSLHRTAQPRDWSSLEQAFAAQSTIVGTVSAVVKGGLHVDIGVRAFLPASRSGARDAAEIEELVGQEIRCRITKLSVEEEDVVVDRRIVTEAEALETRAQRYGQLAEGDVLEGTVRSLADYCAFIDLGGVDGLLHVSDIAWTRITNPSDVLAAGQQVQVKVLKIDSETKRIALGMKQLQPHPWDAAAEKYAAGDKVRGAVTRTTDFGAFVELEPGIEGLVHLSEMSWTRRILKATEVVRTGDVVEATILNLSLPDRRISLSLKQSLGDPWAEAADRLRPGTAVEGTVSSLTRFGAFIRVADGVEGMVHISQIVADRRLNHPSDVLHVGQTVRAQILDLDREKRQLRLSMKQLIPTGLDEFLAEHSLGDRVTGRVVSLAADHAIIELGEQIHCHSALPAPAPEQHGDSAAQGKADIADLTAMLQSRWKTGSAKPTTTARPSALEPRHLEPGQVRSFRIVALDPEQKLIAVEPVA